MKLQSITSIFAVILSGLFGLASTASVVPDKPQQYVMSKHQYESNTLIRLVIPRLDAGDEQKFIALQLEGILKKVNIREAIEELIPALPKGKDMILNQVQRGLKVDYTRATNVMKISVRAGNKQFSRDLADKLVVRYVENSKPKNDEEESKIIQKADIGVSVEKKKN